MTTPFLLPVISAGGVLGALARYGLGVAGPHLWTTVAVNMSGCFLIGVLHTWLSRRRPDQVYLRPFLGVGFLGGYTTFSTAMVETLRSTPAIGLLYLFGTVAGALLAVWAGRAVVPK